MCVPTSAHGGTWGKADVPPSSPSAACSRRLKHSHSKDSKTDSAGSPAVWRAVPRPRGAGGLWGAAGTAQQVMEHFGEGLVAQESQDKDPRWVGEATASAVPPGAGLAVVSPSGPEAQCPGVGTVVGRHLDKPQAGSASGRCRAQRPGPRGLGWLRRRTQGPGQQAGGPRCPSQPWEGDLEHKAQLPTTGTSPAAVRESSARPRGPGSFTRLAPCPTDPGVAGQQRGV